MAATPAQPGRSPRLLAACLLATLAVAGPARTQAPAVGTVQRLKVITLSLRVGCTERESRQVTYTPPPGWYVRSHWVTCTARQGHSSFSVNTVPEAWNWLSEEKVQESYKALIDMAGQSHGVGLQAKLALERDAILNHLRQVRSTHHALVVEATARGEGLLRAPGRIELTVVAELVYVGTEADLRRAAARHRARLQ